MATMRVEDGRGRLQERALQGGRIVGAVDDAIKHFGGHLAHSATLFSSGFNVIELRCSVPTCLVIHFSTCFAEMDDKTSYHRKRRCVRP